MLDDFFVCHAYRFSSAMTAIFHDLIFILSDGAYEIAGRQEMHAPVFFAEILVPVEYLYCAPAFQEADHKAHALIRWYFNQVDVILLDVTLNYRQVLPFAKTPDHVADVKAAHHPESLFGAPDDVVFAFVDIMDEFL
ncbi:MAG: hypothetical protein M0P13_12435 [Fibrobacteraceae bacterium]|nr:hypothetical protein [Fibrobacteraceae bacterium]